MLLPCSNAYKTTGILVNKTAFIYLTAFSRTGGIEQFNKNVMASFHQSAIEVEAIALHDHHCNEAYFSSNHFKGFNGNKWAFIMHLLLNARKYEKVFIGHINLAFAAFLIKLINPSSRLFLFAHGIEVWKKQEGVAAWLLQKVERIFAVSAYTQSTMLANNPKLELGKIQILHNSLDPFFKYPNNFEKPHYLVERYGIQSGEKIILTLARLSHLEQYKGYEQIIKLLKELNSDQSIVKYIIAGKADEQEFNRINQLINQEEISDKVILSGFIKEDELVDHYLLADIFVLPSVGEGFGIVLIEAMACGLQVIAGNKDGSVDALQNGVLGTLVNPTDRNELLKSMLFAISNTEYQKKSLQESVLLNFGFPIFKMRLSNIISHLN